MQKSSLFKNSFYLNYFKQCDLESGLNSIISFKIKNLTTDSDYFIIKQSDILEGVLIEV